MLWYNSHCWIQWLLYGPIECKDEMVRDKISLRGQGNNPEISFRFPIRFTELQDSFQ